MKGTKSPFLQLQTGHPALNALVAQGTKPLRRQFRKCSRKARGEDLDVSCLGGAALFFNIKVLCFLQVCFPINKVRCIIYYA